jgi:CBS domain-containing protein
MAFATESVAINQESEMSVAVRDVMTTRLATVDAGDSPTDAARLMRDEDIGDVLVTENGRLCGIVTDRDLVVRCMAEQTESEIRVGELCSQELVSVSPDDDLDDAIRLMAERDIRRLPVIEGNNAVGILSLGDLAIERDPDSVLGDISAANPNN